MPFIRFYSYACDISGCHSIVVQEYPEGTVVPRSLPAGWWSFKLHSSYSVYICKGCTETTAGDALEKLFTTQFAEPTRLYASVRLTRTPRVD